MPWHLQPYADEYGHLRRHRCFGEPMELQRTCFTGEYEASRQSNNTKKIIEKKEGVGGFMAELGVAPTVAIGDGDASGELAGGQFTQRSNIVASYGPWAPVSARNWRGMLRA